MTNTTARVALALKYMRGPKVGDCVAEKTDVLQAKVCNANNAPTHADTDGALWQEFITEFQRAFAEAVPESL
jgi:hypothetical protein